VNANALDICTVWGNVRTLCVRYSYSVVCRSKTTSGSNESR